MPLSAAQVQRARSLYRTMPGAMPPPFEKGEFMWGDIENSEEWEFCTMVVSMIDDAVGAAVNRLASDHNLV